MSAKGKVKIGFGKKKFCIWSGPHLTSTVNWPGQSIPAEIYKIDRKCWS